jgi:hypothetical protein
LDEQREWRQRQDHLAQQYAMDLSTAPSEFEDLMMTESHTENNLGSMEGLSNDQQDKTMLEVEEIAQQEQMELEALVDLAPQSLNDPEQLPDRSGPPNYDDDDYDSLFMEFITEDTTSVQPSIQHHDVDMGTG